MGHGAAGWLGEGGLSFHSSVLSIHPTHPSLFILEQLLSHQKSLSHKEGGHHQGTLTPQMRHWTIPEAY